MSLGDNSLQFPPLSARFEHCTTTVRALACGMLLVTVILLSFSAAGISQVSSLPTQSNGGFDSPPGGDTTTGPAIAGIQNQTAVSKIGEYRSNIRWQTRSGPVEYRSHDSDTANTSQTQQTASIAFLNQPEPNGSNTVTIDSVRLGSKLDSDEKFVVVVHQTQTGGLDGGVGTKIGESEIISGEPQSPIIVDLSRSVSDTDSVSQLTESQALVAMLYFADTSGQTRHGDPVRQNGSPVTDRSQIAVSTRQAQQTESELGSTTPADDSLELLTIIGGFACLIVGVLLYFRYNK